jgi:ABC-2 type transport system ATP-binding protein
MDDVAIKVEGLHKSFKLPHEKTNSLKGAFVSVFRGKRTYETQKVLKDVSFEIKKGEFFGIVGRNGSGKSTLLKLLAGIYTPDKGTVQVNGKLTPFIELGVGFNPELTGRENVYLNGALLGFSRKEMDELYEDIVSFAELEKFMDQKLKNYSSGMQVRLAFSIAIRANTGILLIDEVLAVGDLNFQRKCLNYFKKLKQNKQTVVFVSHDMGAVQEFCDKVIIVDDGEKVFDGNPTEASALYNTLNFSQDDTPTKLKKQKHYGNGNAYIKEIAINVKGKQTKHLMPKQTFSISTSVLAKRLIKNPLIGIQIEDNLGNIIISQNNRNEQKITLEEGDLLYYSITLENVLHNGTYFISVAIKSEDGIELYDQLIRDYNFEVSGWNVGSAFIHANTTSKYFKSGRNKRT